MADEILEPAADPMPAAAPVPAAAVAPAPATEPAKGTAEPVKAEAWRESIADAELKKVAERFASPADLAKAVADFRKRESTSIRIPGADAKPEEVAAFRERLGVPKDAAGYAEVVNTRPAHIDEAVFTAEPMKQALGEYAAAFHAAGLTKGQVADVLKAHWALDAKAREAAVAADKAFATASETALRQKWPGQEFDRNKIAANKAAEHFLGEAFNDAKKLETKDGRFLLDHPVIVEAFAKIGREMGEDRIGPSVTPEDVKTNAVKIDDLTRQMHTAMASGDRRTAQRLDEERNRLIQRTVTNRPVVGAAGRVA